VTETLKNEIVISIGISKELAEYAIIMKWAFPVGVFWKIGTDLDIWIV